jgi:hypothetical protein
MNVRSKNWYQFTEIFWPKGLTASWKFYKQVLGEYNSGGEKVPAALMPPAL